MASTGSVHTVRKVAVVTIPVIIVQADHTGTTVTQGNHIILITLTLVLSSSGSLSEHQPGQWLQTL